jgi:catalase
MLYRDVMGDVERERLVANLTGHLSEVDVEAVLERSLAYLRQIDGGLGARVAAGLGRGKG